MQGMCPPGPRLSYSELKYIPVPFSLHTCGGCEVFEQQPNKSGALVCASSLMSGFETRFKPVDLTFNTDHLASPSLPQSLFCCIH